MLAPRLFSRMSTDAHRTRQGIGVLQIAVWRAAWFEA
jgi:hypothetical protein